MSDSQFDGRVNDTRVDTAVEADPESGSASALFTSGRPALVLIRHGETEWSKRGQHTGRTDIELTKVGEDQARAAGELVRRLLDGARPSLVISSPRQRALRTAELAGFTPQVVTEDAAEWDYGDYEGRTSADIRREDPGWTIWSGQVPGGETADQVTARLDRVVTLATTHQEQGPVLTFSHGHASRCVAARWLGEPVSAGRHYWLGTGAVSSLGYERDSRVILRWNLDGSIIQSIPWT